jgi:hypothetical protein
MCLVEQRQDKGKLASCLFLLVPECDLLTYHLFTSCPYNLSHAFNITAHLPPFLILVFIFDALKPAVFEPSSGECVGMTNDRMKVISGTLALGL